MLILVKELIATQTIGQGRCRGLVNDAEDIEPGNVRGVLCGLPF